MKLDRKAPFFVIASWGFVLPLAAQSLTSQPPVPEAAHQAASRALESLPKLVTSENVQIFGFEAPGQVSDAELGSPFQDYLIGLNDLIQWDGTDPVTLLHYTGRLIYPITLKGFTRSSITLAQKEGTWKAVAFGAVSDSQSRARIRDNSRNSIPSKGDNVGMQVRIPSLNVTFVGQLEKNGQLMFTPVQSAPRFELMEGQTENAKEILLRLKPIAKELDPNVPN